MACGSKAVSMRTSKIAVVAAWLGLAGCQRTPDAEAPTGGSGTSSGGPAGSSGSVADETGTTTTGVPDLPPDDPGDDHFWITHAFGPTTMDPWEDDAALCASWTVDNALPLLAQAVLASLQDDAGALAPSGQRSEGIGLVGRSRDHRIEQALARRAGGHRPFGHGERARGGHGRQCRSRVGREGFGYRFGGGSGGGFIGRVGELGLVAPTAAHRKQPRQAQAEDAQPGRADQFIRHVDRPAHRVGLPLGCNGHLHHWFRRDDGSRRDRLGRNARGRLRSLRRARGSSRRGTRFGTARGPFGARDGRRGCRGLGSRCRICRGRLDLRQHDCRRRRRGGRRQGYRRRHRRLRRILRKSRGGRERERGRSRRDGVKRTASYLFHDGNKR